MDFRIAHELPGRLRLTLEVPLFPYLNGEHLVVELRRIEGVRGAGYNRRTRNLLVSFADEKLVRANVLNTIHQAEFTPANEPGSDLDEDARQKRDLIDRMVNLFLTERFIPAALKPFPALKKALPYFKEAGKALKKREFDATVLDASAIGVSLVMGDYFTAGMISLLLQTGGYLEDWSRRRVRRNLARMFHNEVEVVWVIRDGMETSAPIEEVHPGDLVVIQSGSLIPVDGIAEEGQAMVNQATITGEPLPVLKEAGQEVHAGSVVVEGRIVVRATRVGTETRVAKIIQAIEESQSLKAELHSRAEHLADKLAPDILFLGLATFLITGSLSRAASVLLVDYSCAIKLSTPLAIVSAMLESSRHGVLVKGGKFVEKLGRSDVFVLDKTGTLTESRPHVFEVVTFGRYSPEYILKQAACLEEHFPHPLARAVVSKAEEEGLIHEEEHAEVEYVVARGLLSHLGDKRILVGSRRFVQDDYHIDLSAAETAVQRFAHRGLSYLFVAIEDRLEGVLAFEDPIRKDSRRFLDTLRKDGIEKIIMLTGDSKQAAGNVADHLGIEEFYAEILPENKLSVIQGLIDKGYLVAMMGDGINDSSALSTADVGISMKHGADIAQEAADVLLINDNLASICDSRIIARKALDRIERNYEWIAGVNTSLIFLGLFGMIPPQVSAIAHNGTTVMTALNAIRPYLRTENKDS